jgi:hypothetical protein
MEKLMKALLVFWGIVLGSMALKFLSSFTPSKIDFSISDYIDTDAISKMLHLTSSNQEQIQTEKIEIKIDVPHPKKLYTFKCNSHMTCKKIANTYIVNVDGIDFIPSKQFIFTCLTHKNTNKFCTSFIPIGDTESIQFDSIPMMHSYIDNSKNPEFNNHLTDWKKRNLKKAKEKIKSSL